MLGYPDISDENTLGKREQQDPNCSFGVEDANQQPQNPGGLERRVEFLENKLATTENELQTLKTEFAKLSEMVEKLKSNSNGMFEAIEEQPTDAEETDPRCESVEPEHQVNEDDEDSAHYQIARKMYESSCSETDERDERSANYESAPSAAEGGLGVPECAEQEAGGSQIIAEGNSFEQQGDEFARYDNGSYLHEQDTGCRGNMYRGRGYPGANPYHQRAMSVKPYKRSGVPPISYRGGYIGKNFQPYYNPSPLPHRGYARGFPAYSRGFSRFPPRGYRGSYNMNYRGGVAFHQDRPDIRGLIPYGAESKGLGAVAIATSAGDRQSSVQQIKSSPDSKSGSATKPSTTCSRDFAAKSKPGISGLSKDVLPIKSK